MRLRRRYTAMGGWIALPPCSAAEVPATAMLGWPAVIIRPRRFPFLALGAWILTVGVRLQHVSARRGFGLVASLADGHVGGTLIALVAGRTASFRP